MIEFSRHRMANGMRVIVCEDRYAPLATFNMLYAVGARHERPERTGFAHLFEHLMFGGSANVPDFDYEVQRVGGDANAFTTNDVTNYYMTLPADNIETAFWLESDRLLSPVFSQETLDVQRRVVIEEFRQRYLNTPYGDCQHLFRDLVYKVHPYRWPTIGRSVEQIADATLEEVKDFFYRLYTPGHAILSVCGDVRAEEIFGLAEKWFGGISRGGVDVMPDVEPEQRESRRLEVVRDVPATRVSIAFHTGGRLHRDTKLGDLMTDVLADGDSSRLIQHLIKGSGSCTDVNAFISGSVDPGTIVFTGQVADGVEPERVEEEIWGEIESMQSAGPTEYELRKARNRQLSEQVFAETATQALAQSLSMYEMLGDAGLINTEPHGYDDVTPDDVREMARRVCTRENSSTMIYRHK